MNRESLIKDLRKVGLAGEDSEVVKIEKVGFDKKRKRDIYKYILYTPKDSAEPQDPFLYLPKIVLSTRGIYVLSVELMSDGRCKLYYTNDTHDKLLIVEESNPEWAASAMLERLETMGYKKQECKRTSEVFLEKFETITKTGLIYEGEK